MPAYRCEYIPEVDLLVVVLVAARSSDFDQPHPIARIIVILLSRAVAGAKEASTVGAAAPKF